jgi:hypothetical protein
MAIGTTSVHRYGLFPAPVCQPTAAPDARPEQENSFAFALLLLGLAVVFISPPYLAPALQDAPIYMVIVVPCIILSIPNLRRQLTPASLVRNPMVLCLLLYLPAITLSHFTHMALRETFEWTVEYSKILIHVLLVVGLVNSAKNFRAFTRCYLFLVVIVVVIGMIDYYNLFHIESIRQFAEKQVDPMTGEKKVMFFRLRSINWFHDPNALGLLISGGVLICLYEMASRRGVFFLPVGLLILGLFGWAFVLTESKGGFLALACSLLALCVARAGKKGVIAAAILLSLLLTLFAGRATTISPDDQSAQDRFALWERGLPYFQQNLLFGIGAGQYREIAPQVAHNSFWEPFVEVGSVGGALFLGAYYFGAMGLLWLGPKANRIQLGDAELQRFWPYLVGIFLGSSFSLLTQPRNWAFPTYTMMAMVAAYLRIASFRGPAPVRWGIRHLAIIGVLSVLFVLSVWWAVRTFSA